MALNYYMNIVDTSTNINGSNFDDSIENIPLFKIEPIKYEISDSLITDIVFQSVASVKHFKHFEICIESDVSRREIILSEHALKSNYQE